MRVAFLVASLLALAASPAVARVAPQMPGPMEEAPVERAIENVARDQRLAPAQRERLLGRLHLIGYAQIHTLLTRYSNGEWQPEEIGPCGDRAYAFEGTPRTCPFGHEGLATRELPERRGALSSFARNHLNQARAHYQRAVALDNTNLRALLGLAYVLDELDEDETARIFLRRIIELAQSRFNSNQYGRNWIEWEDYVVLNEAVEHLSDLARSREDRAGVARLRTQLGNSRPSGWVTPIVVPLRDAPFTALTDAASAVAFDFAGTGYTRTDGWLRPDAAWLVWDPNRRGDVSSGFDLLGQRTWAVFWNDGFEAMRSLDDDGDGELTGAELGGLALWRDANVNGISEPGEVRPVSAHGVVALSVRGERVREGLLTASGGVRFDDGTRLPLYDWTPGLERAPTS